ncbi:hypothetical protein, partial [Adlercreutzia mucosicola]|uniref:hypothetical protein n=1 Tax=Adlercreutzia mucosicola TaxID=580026 RepID=UPI002B25223F
KPISKYRTASALMSVPYLNASPLKASGTGNFCFQSHYRGSVHEARPSVVSPVEACPYEASGGHKRRGGYFPDFAGFL